MESETFEEQLTAGRTTTERGTKKKVCLLWHWASAYTSIIHPKGLCCGVRVKRRKEKSSFFSSFSP
jgi:hypothetical protein